MGILYLARHGETEWNRKKICMGKKDIVLNSKGIKQANELGKSIKNLGIDLIITSPLIRCKKTAKIINQYIDRKILVEPCFIEINVGTYEGLSDRDIIIKIYNGVVPGSETVNDIQKRVFEAIEELKKEYLDKKILVVTHGFVGKVIYK